MTQIIFTVSRGSAHPEAAGRSDSQLANICRLMSPLMAITTHNVITPLNSLFPSALWLLLPAALSHKHTQAACRPTRASFAVFTVRMWLKIALIVQWGKCLNNSSASAAKCRLEGCVCEPRCSMLPDEVASKVETFIYCNCCFPAVQTQKPLWINSLIRMFVKLI